MLYSTGLQFHTPNAHLEVRGTPPESGSALNISKSLRCLYVDRHLTYLMDESVKIPGFKGNRHEECSHGKQKGIRELSSEEREIFRGFLLYKPEIIAAHGLPQIFHRNLVLLLGRFEEDLNQRI